VQEQDLVRSESGQGAVQQLEAVPGRQSGLLEAETDVLEVRPQLVLGMRVRSEFAQVLPVRRGKQDSLGMDPVDGRRLGVEIRPPQRYPAVFQIVDQHRHAVPRPFVSRPHQARVSGAVSYLGCPAGGANRPRCPAADRRGGACSGR
jgi:hypothetical protein